LRYFMMSCTPLTHDERSERLKEQLGFLDTSSRLYDEGHEHEAIRLARTIRVLVHDTDRSRSLLGLLGVKTSITFWSVHYGEAGPSSISFVGIGKRLHGYGPILLPPRRRLAFEKWWEDELLYVKGDERLTRQRAVLTLADKDEGAHVDPKLKDSDLTLLIRAAVRQIAHELRGTIREHLVHLLG
jgi:hypothetical protein